MTTKASMRFKLLCLCVAGILVGSVTAIFSHAQVDVVEKPPAKIKKSKDDPLQSLITAPDAPAGKLIYAYRPPLKGGPQRQPSNIVVRQIGKTTAKAAAPESPEAAYSVTPPFADIVFQPQFSPDGRFILLKVGWPLDRHGTYQIFFWDIKAKKLRKGPPEGLSFPIVQWAPNKNNLAYIRNGDIHGFEYAAPLELYLYSLESGKSRKVAQSERVTNFVWTHQGTLLYTNQPEPSTPPAPKKKDKTAIWRPANSSIYEVSVAGGKPKSIITDVYYRFGVLESPIAPSPDGRWIAFFGYSGTGEKVRVLNKASQPSPQREEQPALYLFNRTTKKRFAIDEKPVDEFLCWTPDSRHLLRIHASYRGDRPIHFGSDDVIVVDPQGKKEKGLGEALVTAVDVATLQSREVGVVQAEDRIRIMRARATPQFSPLQVSHDGKWLFMTVHEVGAPRGNMLRDVFSSVQAINLQDGKVIKIAVLKNAEGVDWYDESSKTVNTQN